MGFRDYSATPASNTNVLGSIFTGPNMARADVDNALRQIMADARQFADLQPITPDDYSGTDTQKVQAALDVGGAIRLTRSYAITSTLTIGGDTQLVGAPGAKLVWSGPTTGNILQDSSVTTYTDVNLNILLENFEIDGGDLVTGDSGQIGINFYRTGNVTMRGLNVHGVGGSGVRWGNSYTDTIGVLVENCTVYDCRAGDAIQGSGRKITVRNNRVGVVGSVTSNFGDTGIALIADNGAHSATTNPSGLFSSDVEISGNTVIGNYSAGTYVGVGGTSQTGIAFGPFAIGAGANIRVEDNTVSGCYLNLWGIVMDDVSVSKNRFGAHAATATGNIRFDGVTNLRVKDNAVTLSYAGTGADYSGILLVAQRNTYGGSVFDADVSNFEVSGNTITSIVTAIGIRATFEEISTSPSYTSKLTTGRFEGNSFNGIATPVVLAPVTGTTASVCTDVTVRGNKPDSTATAVLTMNGIASQYVNVRLLDNPALGTTAPFAGTGIADLVVQHKTFAKLTSIATATPTTILSIPATGYGRLDVNAWVTGGNSARSASATIVFNNGAARISNQSDGGSLALTLSGLNVQANQSTGGAADIRATGTYS
jgi:hypothetical protein